MENMTIYDNARSVPDNAKKKITGGRLNGMTDINPMYRIKRMTEIFGPCGIGWWYKITDKRIIDDEATGQRAAFVDIDLFYVHPETGQISNAIPGTGGAAFLAKESKGLYLSDECFKMALTDALSVACKALGIAADVYWEKDRTKYTTATDNTPQSREEDQAELAKTRARTAAKEQPTNDQPAKQLATDEQKKKLYDAANDAQRAACDKMYGEHWAIMTAAQCAAMLRKIEKGVAC